MPTTIAHTCLLCGSTDATVLCEFPEITWVACECGLIFKRSEAVPAVEYQEEYFVNRENVRRQYNTRNRRRIRKSRNQILDVLNHVDPGPLLDVGCARGHTLQAAEDLGLTATGVDISEHAVRYCGELGFSARLGTLEQLPSANSSLQIVIMKHVLEHTRTPREALREVSRVLRPGGAVFIAVPHAGYLKARMNPAASRFFRPDSPGGREHYVYYTPRTLIRLLKEESYEPVHGPHPHLVHRRAGGLERVRDAAIAPFRFAAQRARSALALYKEFWVVAIR
jgi:2-polyprenyl-3-methyl-5-hydroxy-6-metoxy-1,4-benzoquinol methylase